MQVLLAFYGGLEEPMIWENVSKPPESNSSHGTYTFKADQRELLTTQCHRIFTRLIPSSDEQNLDNEEQD